MLSKSILVRKHWRFWSECITLIIPYFSTLKMLRYHRNTQGKEGFFKYKYKPTRKVYLAHTYRAYIFSAQRQDLRTLSRFSLRADGYYDEHITSNMIPTEILCQFESRRIL
jgi:hypothetical protein